jgi:hypothetical protein
MLDPKKFDELFIRGTATLGKTLRSTVHIVVRTCEVVSLPAR